MTIRGMLVYAKQCYSRSMGYFGYVTQFLIITANIKLFEIYIVDIGISILQAILIAIPLFLFGNLIIGHIDLKYGIWREENNFTWEVTPMAHDLCAGVKRIEAKLNEE
jgi:hypothetical protein